MSKFLPQKRKLLEEVFEKASQETPEKSFSGILKYLETRLLEDFRIVLSYKTFENYYKQIVQNDLDYNIKSAVLDDLSRYLEYNNFNEYCAEWKTVEHILTEKASKVTVHVVNKPLLVLPEFLTKQSNLGIIGILLIGGIFAGNKMLNSDKNNSEAKQGQVAENLQTETVKIHHIVDVPAKSNVENTENKSIVFVKEKECMFWNKDHYEKTFCDENIAGRNLMAYQEEAFNLVKILRPDTLTVENAYTKVWYIKEDNKIEFFSSYGKHPENGKTLKEASKYILRKYGKQEASE